MPRHLSTCSRIFTWSFLSHTDHPAHLKERSFSYTQYYTNMEMFLGVRTKYNTWLLWHLLKAKWQMRILPGSLETMSICLLEALPKTARGRTWTKHIELNMLLVMISICMTGLKRNKSSNMKSSTPAPRFFNLFTSSKPNWEKPFLRCAWAAAGSGRQDDSDTTN